MSLSSELYTAANNVKHLFEQSKKISKDLLYDAETPASLLLISLIHNFGKDVFTFEPESIWLTLDDKLPEINKDKILSAIALDNNPIFYNDWRTFGNTALAFSNKLVMAAEAPAPTASEMAWAVFEAEIIFSLLDTENIETSFSDEVESFIAILLQDAGLVLAPELLEFVQPILDNYLNEEAKELQAKIKQEWKETPKTNLEHAKFEESVLGVQLKRLADVHRYLVHQAKLLTR